jgi:hypothetical protein
VDQICQNLAKRDYKFRSLIIEVVKSVPFQMQRGTREDLAANAPATRTD